MHSPRRFAIPILIILVFAVIAIWYFSQERNSRENALLAASGTVEAVEVAIAPEIGGRVAEVFVEKGDFVQAGDKLLQLDGDLLQAQRQRALAALEAANAGLTSAQSALEMARANLETAKAGVEAAQVQLEIAVRAARAADAPARAKAWERDLPTEFTQPAWYFRKSEDILAAEAEVSAAQQMLDAERLNYEKLLQESGDKELQEAEARLTKAQAAFLVAQDVLDRAKAQSDKEIQEYAQDIFDSAESELEAAQSEFERLLSGEVYVDLREARARWAVAEERLQTARDRLDALLTGEDALQVRAAETALKQAEKLAAQAEVGVRQAENALKGAEKTVAQAQAELDLIDVQLNKLVIHATSSGVITARNIEPGEVIQAGATVLTLSQLDRLHITVYLPEDRYGQVSLGQRAQVKVDSFPMEVFTAVVTRIADRAEYTPRNVQTEEGRRTTVFAVELAVDNPEGKLKPGMPADVTFTD